MAAYRRSSGVFEGIFAYVFFGYWIHHFFGWEGLAVGIVGISAIILVLAQYSKFKGRKEEEERIKASCKHGTSGALYGLKPCARCQEEKEAEIRIAREKAAEEEARKKAEKERRYKEWVAKIRLPEYLLKMHPQEFEDLVCDLFRKMGYEVEHTQYSGDGGIDGYLKKDGELSILQCKRVKGSVGEPILRDLFGTMHDKGAKEGLVVTTGKVSMQASQWAANKPIRIIERDELVNHIRTCYKEDEVVPEQFSPDNKKNASCPKCGRPLKVVNWKGKRFMGCSGYPSCRYTKALRDERYHGT